VFESVGGELLGQPFKRSPGKVGFCPLGSPVESSRNQHSSLAGNFNVGTDFASYTRAIDLVRRSPHRNSRLVRSRILQAVSPQQVPYDAVESFHSGQVGSKVVLQML